MTDIRTPFTRQDAGQHILMVAEEVRLAYARNLDRLSREFHCRAVVRGWWDKPLNFGERLALIHSEISEALEGFRKDKADEHLPQFTSVEVELADALIRIFDLAGAMRLRLGEAVVAKALYNETRADHNLDARQAEGGKKF